MHEKLTGFWCYLKKARLLAGTLTVVGALLIMVFGYIYKIGGKTEKLKESINRIPAVVAQLGRHEERLDGHDVTFAQIIEQNKNMLANQKRMLTKLDR